TALNSSDTPQDPYIPKEKRHVELGHYLSDHRHRCCRTGLRWYRRHRHRHCEDSFRGVPGDVHRVLHHGPSPTVSKRRSCMTPLKTLVTVLLLGGSAAAL